MIKRAENIIKKYYPEDSEAYRILVQHSLSVTHLALRIARHNKHLDPDLEIIELASMLHDIGIYKTRAPEIGCHGDLPYICHGYIGRELLEKEGLTVIAPICERHIGVGITKQDILDYNFPVPLRNMVPISIEEKIICYADKFYSKNTKHLDVPKPTDKILKKLTKYGKQKVDIFKSFMELFGTEYIYK
ncbi:MAG: HD domain-containing protein [Bacteroidota bacterium]|nr:HD domain-containing protein [Bacteroidota bacterium]